MQKRTNVSVRMRGIMDDLGAVGSSMHLRMQLSKEIESSRGEKFPHLKICVFPILNMQKMLDYSSRKVRILSNLHRAHRRMDTSNELQNTRIQIPYKPPT